ncbi:hypothetical protein AXF42_Ash015004 [Apostasia shenzhenica]|uniref:GTD-binding domain-containing protein n=1 Tax=Apostasia shenzhenica TaxID=1088818 RepID=A0A2I0B2V2_9ASPA|nr:hypothetical protein AXF42_Ash015004 [Apostasia shenzhenica]
MDSKNPSKKDKRESHCILSALSSAFSEWIIIILLLINAFCLFLVSRICRSCKLQSPCLLCSRLGFLLGNEKLGFYKNLVCDTHKAEISSLLFCDFHKELPDSPKTKDVKEESFAPKFSLLISDDMVVDKLIDPIPISDSSSSCKCQPHEGTDSTSNVVVNKALNLAEANSKANQVISDFDSSESPRLPMDLMQRLSQLAAARCIDASTDSNHRVRKGDECKLSDNSTENVDLPCDESAVDALKRQIEMGRKSLSILYKELEEERNASAIAANEAMAMINKLQEEKAALQLEALQYLRMLEEQNEYDQEAIEKLNDQLTERERDLLDLEEELESYRKKLCGDELPLSSDELECM